MGFYREVTAQIKAALTKILGKEIADQVLQGGQAQELRQRFENKDRPLVLLSFDVDKIKDLVFASTKPLEVNGASEIVNDLTRKEPVAGSSRLPACSVYQIMQDFGLNGNNVLFAGGGTGLLLLPAGQAKEIADTIADRFRQASVNGSCTVVYHTLYPHELLEGFATVGVPADGEGLTGIHSLDCGKNGGRFAAVFRLLADELRQAKEEKLLMPVFPLPGYVKRCQSCGIQPAAEVDMVENETEYLCAGCSAHRERGRREKRRSGLAQAKSVGDIVGSDDARGYVAVIYADANGMGQMFLQMKTMAELSIFSRVVSRIVNGVTNELVNDHQLAGRYQAPVIGGDDILFIVKADRAAALVIDLLQKFKQKAKAEAASLQGDNPELAKLIGEISLSVGFVIVPEHFNIRFTVEYAEIILREAKKGYRQKKKECVDFFVVTDGSPLSFNPQQVRDKFYVNKTANWKINLTRRPLEISAFEELYKDVKLLKQKVARRQLKYLQDLLYHESPGVSKINILYQWIRIPAWWEGVFQKNMQYMDNWQVKFLEEESPGSYHSSISDLMELYPFVEG